MRGKELPSVGLCRRSRDLAQGSCYLRATLLEILGRMARERDNGQGRAAARLSKVLPGHAILT
jgi:hypothetical protein